MGKKKGIIFSAVVFLVFTMIILCTFLEKNVDNVSSKIKQELLRSGNYAELTKKDSDIENCDFVKFNAFFLRDIDQDGNANLLNGTCKNVSETDTLYMDINVLSKGYLKEGAKITINGENFKYKTAIVEDSVIAQNYISDNTKTINLKQIQNGSQKLIYGDIVANLDKNISKYSNKNNTVTFEGVYVDDKGNETNISKTVKLIVDWYANVEAEIPYSYANGKVNTIQTKPFEEMQVTENDVSMTFNIGVQETKNEAILAKNYLEGTIPSLNGYKASNVKVEGTNVIYLWDSETQKFTATRQAKLEENVVTSNANSGSYKTNRYNEYKLTITYPIDAYNLIKENTVNLNIPITTYYLGFTNENKEFKEEAIAYRTN